MRYRDAETEAVEGQICATIGCDYQQAETVFNWAWNLAVERQAAGLDRAKMVYMSILADVLERLARGDGLILPTVH